MKSLKHKYFVILIILIAAIVFLPAVARRIYPLKYTNFIVKYSNQYDLDPYIVVAVIKAESSFNTKAKSPKNAFGLMQITPTTAEWAAKEMKINDFNNSKLNDPEFNISMGCWYLNNLKGEFGGNMDLVLAAYNGGRGNVQKWLNDTSHSKDGKNLHYIPFKETDKYVKRVKVNYNIYKFLYGKKMVN